MAGYVGLQILFDAVKAAGNVDVEEVRAAGSKDGQSRRQCCGAVASDRSLENIPRLRGRENHPTVAALDSARPTRIGRITPGSRV